MALRAATVEIYQRHSRERSAVALGVLILCSLALAALIVLYPPGWLAAIIAAYAALVVATWFRPTLGIASVLGLTILFEQYAFADFETFTMKVPLFANISSFTPISALAASPLEVLLLTIAVVTLARAVSKREIARPNAMAGPILVFAACLLAWSVYGLISGGSATVLLWELRSLAYLCLLVLLVPLMVRRDADVWVILWVAICGVFFKAAQGIWTYAVILRGDLSQVIAITGHEDAVFIGWMLVFLVALCVYRSSVAQRNVLLLASPVMLFTFVATDRRAAYVAVALGLVLLAVLVATDRDKRHLLAKVGIPFLLVCVLVIGAGWNSSGAIGKPARALKSIQQPESTEDVESNYYRRAEEVNLIISIHSSPLLGLGFGRPFQASGSLSQIDFSLADYIPHNEIMWLWAKMGTIGFAVFWAMICSLIAYGCVVFRGSDRPYTRAVAATVVAAVAMQMIVSYVDLQLTFARNMVFLGVLVGVLLRLQSLDDEEVGHVLE